MKLSDMLLPEFDREMGNTRKTLERVPDDKFDYQPHQKSMKMGELATHLAELPNWAVESITRSEFDVAPAGGERYTPPKAGTQQEVLALFDRNAANARAAIAGASDEHLMGNWSLLIGGKALLTRPRIAVLRDFVLSHTIHHRAQLGVYLRMNNLPVPAVYGPSADEGAMS